MATDALDVEAVQQDATVIQELSSRSGDLRDRTSGTRHDLLLSNGFGIGAMLRSEDGYAKIESLVPGGPAQLHEVPPR